MSHHRHSRHGFFTCLSYFNSLPHTQALVSPKIGLDLKPASITLKRGLPDYKSESVEVMIIFA